MSFACASAEDITKEVKKALEKEGYEGEAASVVDQSGDTQQARKQTAIPYPARVYAALPAAV